LNRGEVDAFSAEPNLQFRKCRVKEKQTMKLSTETTTKISSASALALVNAAMAAGNELGVSVSAWVVGPALEKIAFAAADKATPHSRVTSLKKAQTAASTRKATPWMPAELAIILPLATDGLLTNVGGGIPIVIDAIVVAGLGIAGGTVAQDEQVATAALTAFGIGKI
jgi:glc operon protein GlcG